MRQSRMRSLSKPSSPSLCALRTVRETRCFFPSLLPPASPGRAAVCCHPAGCPAGNKVAFCSPARCSWCPCSAQAAPRPARGCAVPRGREARPGLLSRLCPARLCILTLLGMGAMALAGHSGHLQSKQPQGNKHANNSVEKENEEQALSCRGGTYQVWSPLHGRAGVPPARPAVWPVPASRAAKKGKPQPPAVPCQRCGRSPRCQGASEQTGQGASVVWDSATVTAPGAGSAGRGHCGQWRVPSGPGSPEGLSWQCRALGRGFGLCWCHQHGDRAGRTRLLGWRSRGSREEQGGCVPSWQQGEQVSWG